MFLIVSYHILNGRGNLCKHDFGFKFFVRSFFTSQPCKQFPSRGVFKNQVNSRNSFNDFIQPKDRLLGSLRHIISSIFLNVIRSYIVLFKLLLNKCIVCLPFVPSFTRGSSKSLHNVPVTLQSNFV